MSYKIDDVIAPLTPYGIKTLSETILTTKRTLVLPPVRYGTYIPETGSDDKRIAYAFAEMAVTYVVIADATHECFDRWLSYVLPAWLTGYSATSLAERLLITLRCCRKKRLIELPIDKKVLLTTANVYFGHEDTTVYRTALYDMCRCKEDVDTLHSIVHFHAKEACKVVCDTEVHIEMDGQSVPRSEIETLAQMSQSHAIKTLRKESRF